MDILTRLREIEAQIIQLHKTHRALMAMFVPEQVSGPNGRNMISLDGATLHTPIANLDISCRTTNVMKHAGIETLAEVDAMSNDELLRLDNFGRRSLNELREAIAEIKVRQPA